MNRRGEIASGAGEIFVGEQSLGVGTMVRWIDEDRIIFNAYADGGTRLVNVRTYHPLAPKKIIGPPYSTLYGSDVGKWSGFLQTSNPDAVLYDNETEIARTKGRASFVLSPDGKLVAQADRFQDNEHTLYVNGAAIYTGHDDPNLPPAPHGVVMTVTVCNTAVVWSIATSMYGRKVLAWRPETGQIEDWSIADWEDPVAVDGPDGPWVLSVLQDGLALRPGGGTSGYVLAGDRRGPAIRFVDGRFRIAASDGRGVPQPAEIDPALPRQDLRLRVPPLAPYDHPMWAGYFYATSDRYGDNRDAPGTCEVIVEPVVARTRRPVIVAEDVYDPLEAAKTVAIWHSAATIEELERLLSNALFHQHPQLAYLDAEWSRPLLPQGRTVWAGVQAYCRAGESFEAFAARVRRQMDTCGVNKIALVCQAYDTNAGLTTDLFPLQGVHAVLACDPRVVAVLWFSDGRALSATRGGVRVHPELRLWHNAMLAAIPGTPPIRREEDVKPPKVDIPAVIPPFRADGFVLTVTDPNNNQTVTIRTVAGGWKVGWSTPGGRDESAKFRAVVIAQPGPVPQPDPQPQPEPPPRPAPTPVGGSDVSFTAPNGKMLCADLKLGPSAPLMANRDSVGGSYEQFDVEVLPSGKVTVKAKANNRYVRAVGSGGGPLFADRDTPYADEEFTLLPGKDGKGVCFRTGHGQLWSVLSSGGGIVMARAEGEPTDAETFIPSVELFRSNVLLPLQTGTRIFMAGSDPLRWKGVSAFPLADLFAKGEDITPFLRYFGDLGYNVLRVWPYVPNPPWVPGWNPPDNATFLNFIEACRNAGFYVEVTLLTDDDPARVPWAQQFVEFLVDRGMSSVVTTMAFEIGNEPLTNKHIDVAALKPICERYGLVYSSGIYEDPAQSFGSYLTTHTPRDSEWPRKAHDLLEFWAGGGPEAPSNPPHKVPVVADEPIRPDQAGYAERDFYAYAATCSLLGAGATFHYEGGKFGRLPNAQEAACAEAFAAGLDVFPPDAPLGPYRRIDESGKTLRTYVVGSYMVRIRPTVPEAPEPGWAPLDAFGIAFRR